MSETCKTCRFNYYEPPYEDHTGFRYHGRSECRKNAPVVEVSIDPRWGYKPEGRHTMTAWPSVSRDDWCGDHQRAAQ